LISKPEQLRMLRRVSDFIKSETTPGWSKDAAMRSVRMPALSTRPGS
jgi:hypothetical protein